MSKKPTITTQKDDKIEWLGMDGFLCVLFVALSVFIGFSLINNLDIVIGYIVPIGVALATTIVFIKYLTQVLHFSKKNRKNKKN